MTSHLRAGLVVGLAATAVLATSACNSSSKKSSGSSSPTSSAATSAAATSAAGDTSSADTSAAAVDGTTLLLDATDIDPAEVVKTPATPISQSGVTGAAIEFANADGTRLVGETVLVYPSEDAAKTGVEASYKAAEDTVPGVDAQDVTVGDGGKVYAGNKKGGGTLTTAVVFRDGTAVVVLEFDSGLGDALPAELGQTITLAADSKVKAGLAG